MRFISKLRENDIIIIILALVIVVLGVLLADHMEKLGHVESELKNAIESYDMFLEFFCGYQLEEQGLDECWEIKKFGDR